MARAVRRQYIVKRDLQFKLFTETAVFLFFVAVLVGWTIYLGIFRALLFELSGEKITLVNRLISVRLLLWLVPTILSIVVISVFLSHRIAGPLFVIQRAMDDIVNNRPVRRLHLRKYDKLKDVASDMNRLIDHLEAAGTIQVERR